MVYANIFQRCNGWTYCSSACHLLSCLVMCKVGFWRSYMSVDANDSIHRSINAYNSEIFWYKPLWKPGNRRVIFIFFSIIINVWVSSCPPLYHLNTYVMGLRQLYNFFQCGDRFSTWEFDVYSRRIRSKIGPRAEILVFGLLIEQVGNNGLSTTWSIE